MNYPPESHFVKLLRSSMADAPAVVGLDNKIYGDSFIRNCSLDGKTVIGERGFLTDSHLGYQVRIDRDCQIMNSSIGLRSYTGRFSLIFDSKIGKYNSISYGVVLGAASHKMDRPSSHPFIYKSADQFYGIFGENAVESELFDNDFEVGNDVWIGANVTTVRNLTIGSGAVIGANSFVNKDVPPYAIAVGSPAKIIGYRYPPEIIDRLLTLAWWDWDDEKISRNHTFFTNPLTIESFDSII